jgi:hypothetical protein
VYHESARGRQDVTLLHDVAGISHTYLHRMAVISYIMDTCIQALFILPTIQTKYCLHSDDACFQDVVGCMIMLVRQLTAANTSKLNHDVTKSIFYDAQ